MTSTTASTLSARTRSGHSRRKRSPSSSSSSVCGRTDFPAFVVELRSFCSQLFFPKDRIWFYAVMPEKISIRHLADPAAMARLREWNLTEVDWLRVQDRMIERLVCFFTPGSTTLKSRRFNSTIRRVQEFNRLGYDICICNNPLSFGKPLCGLTVGAARSVVLQGGHEDRQKWLDWLDEHRRFVLTAVDSGDELQLTVKINPIRNFQCVEDYRYRPEPGDDKSAELPEFDRIAAGIEDLAKRDGLNPDPAVVRDLAGLIRCPGFTNALTGQPCRLLHPGKAEVPLSVAGATADSVIIAPVTAAVAVTDPFPPAPVEVPAAAEGRFIQNPASRVEIPKIVDPGTDVRPKTPTPRKPSKRQPKKPRVKSRRRIPSSSLGQPKESDNIRFHVKVDAAEVLSPDFLQHADQANFIQHRMVMGRMLGDLDETGTYTLLKSAYLRKVVYADLLRPLLKDMEKAGLIERDGEYIIHDKSYGYRFAGGYRAAKTIEIPCRSPKLSRRIRWLLHEDFRHYTKVHKHLFMWLGRLHIDPVTAEKIIQEIGCAGKNLTIAETREIQQLTVRALLDGKTEFKVCNYGRVHTVVTRMLKALRRELRIDGQLLAAVDISNSQPLFLLPSLLAAMQQNSQKVDSGRLKLLPSSSLHTMSFSSKDTQNEWLMTNNAQGIRDETLATNGQIPADLDHYRQLCETGKLYEFLMSKMGWTEGKDAFKEKELFRFLYGTNGPRDATGKHNPSRLQPVFEAEFPSVWGFIRAWKRRYGYKDLACEMQRAESKLMIEGVCGRLMVEHPDCPLITIHDCILTTPAWVEVVKAAMLAEFAKIGIKPTLHVEVDGVATS